MEPTASVGSESELIVVLGYTLKRDADPKYAGWYRGPGPFAEYDIDVKFNFFGHVNDRVQVHVSVNVGHAHANAIGSGATLDEAVSDLPRRIADAQAAATRLSHFASLAAGQKAAESDQARAGDGR